MSSSDSAAAGSGFTPTSSVVDPLLTDLYQISMAYAYWVAGKQDQDAIFDLFFRKNPFKGEYTIFAGLEECLRYVNSFRFTESMVSKLRVKFPQWPDAFWSWIATLDASKVSIYAMPEGSIAFPRVPLLRVEGPLAVVQLMETTLLCLVNFPSLVCTNAARHRYVAGKDKLLLEFGLRRAQGPDGAMSASRYSVMGGFDGTSNVSAAIKFGLDCKGTMAHSFVTSFSSLSEIKKRTLKSADGKSETDFVALAQKWRKQLKRELFTNEGELASFIAFAQAFPTRFLALIDTYDTVKSGIWNYLAVALALDELGYKARGIRLDSGDLAYLSRQCREIFETTAKEMKIAYIAKTLIVASNDLSEKVIHSLNAQGHSIDAFGVGTNLVTCKPQPALGCVYKLVQLNGKPRIKISQEVAKVTIPGRKQCYRLFNSKNEPVLDLLMAADEKAPTVGERILCKHPFNSQKRVYVRPSKVEPLLKLYFDKGELKQSLPELKAVRERVQAQISMLRDDHLRHLNPTPYKTSLSESLHGNMHRIWQEGLPVAEIE